MDFIYKYWKSFTSFFFLSCLIIIIIFSFAYSSVCLLLTRRYAFCLLVGMPFSYSSVAVCLLISMPFAYSSVCLLLTHQ